MIRVALADDQALVRIGLKVLIEDQADMEVVGEASDGKAAVELVRKTRPDVMLMDIRMPVSDGLQALASIASDSDLQSTRVVMLTTFELDEYVFEALRSGASGFLIKDSEPADLLRAIRTAVSGEALLSPSVTRRLIEDYATRSPRAWSPHPELGSLTPREQEIVTVVAEGLSNDEIAHRLFLSPATVRTHVGRAMAKLGARDRAQLVVFAYQSGLAGRH